MFKQTQQRIKEFEISMNKRHAKSDVNLQDKIKITIKCVMLLKMLLYQTTLFMILVSGQVWSQ